MVKCKRMKRQRCMSKNWAYSWQWKSSRTRQQYCRSAMKTGIPTNGSMSKTTSHWERDSNNSIQRTSFIIVVPGLSSSSSGSSSTLRTSMKQESRSSSSSSSSSPYNWQNSGSITGRWNWWTSVDDRSGQPNKTQANNPPKTKWKGNHDRTGNPSDSEIPEWLQEFREILVDDEIPLQGGSHASSSHEASLEPTFKRREHLGKHNVHTHFPEDQNCEICKRTKITRAPCRRRKGEAVPRADNFGDLTSADHKVPNDNCESRNNHRYAVVLQDLATQWIQAYPCKNKTSQETQISL